MIREGNLDDEGVIRLSSKLFYVCASRDREASIQPCHNFVLVPVAWLDRDCHYRRNGRRRAVLESI